jgi:beta-xylosidase
LKNGEWEQYPAPVLEGGRLWKCSGHGTPVQTPDGRYFYLYHAYNACDFEFVGRQGLLDELRWDDRTGWLYFRYGTNPSEQAEMPFKDCVQKERQSEYSFRSTDWQWDVKLGNPTVSKGKKGIMLTPEKGKGFAFTGVRPLNGKYTASVELLDKGHNFSGLCVYGNKDNFVSFGVEKDTLKLYQMKQAEKNVLFQQPLKNRKLYLKIDAIFGRLFHFCWSSDFKQWNSCLAEKLDVSFVPQWGGAIHVGLAVESGSGEFGSFSLESRLSCSDTE